MPDQDVERYTRYEQQVRGFEPMYQKLNKAGIKTAEDFDKYAPAIDTFNKHKIDPKAFASMYSPEAEADLNPGNKTQSIDIDALRKQIEEGVMGKYEERVHIEARKGDDKIIEAAFNKVVGDDSDDFNKELTKRAVKDWLEENRSTYPEGHPLAGKFLAPLSQKQAEQAVEYFTGLKAKQKGSQMAEVASAANASAGRKVSTAAGGGSSPSGKPNTQNQSPMEQKRTRAEQVLAAIDAKRAAARS